MVYPPFIFRLHHCCQEVREMRGISGVQQREKNPDISPHTASFQARSIVAAPLLRQHQQRATALYALCSRILYFWTLSSFKSDQNLLLLPQECHPIVSLRGSRVRVISKFVKIKKELIVRREASGLLKKKKSDRIEIWSQEIQRIKSDLSIVFEPLDPLQKSNCCI